MTTETRRHETIRHMAWPNQPRRYKDRCTRCKEQATRYVVIYDHNEHPTRPCGMKAATMLLVAACDACLEQVMWGLDVEHSQCMGHLVDIKAVDALMQSLPSEAKR